VARDRKSSQRRRANAQPARARPKPGSRRPADGITPPPPAGEFGDQIAGLSPPEDGTAAGDPPARPADTPVAGDQAGQPVPADPPLGDGLRPGDGIPAADGLPAPDRPPGGDGLPAGDALPGDPLPGDDDDNLADRDGPPADDPLLGHESVITELDPVDALDPPDAPIGALPLDLPVLPPVKHDDDDQPARARARERLAANRLDESDEILPAARRAGRPQAKVGGNKVTAFLRASWAELQRVQWPDRRQVGQATAVVLGFVVVAGGFLGLADLLSQDLVNAIL
jgi:preprotein translocase SecE subunit